MHRFLAIFGHVVFMIYLSGVTDYAMAALIQIDKNILYDQCQDGSGLYWYADINRFYNMRNEDVLVEIDVLNKEYDKQYSFELPTRSDVHDLYDNNANQDTIDFGLFNGTAVGDTTFYNGRIGEWEPDIGGVFQYSLSIYEDSSGWSEIMPGEVAPGIKYPKLGAWVKVAEVPVPSSMLLLGSGLVSLAGICRKKLKK